MCSKHSVVDLSTVDLESITNAADESQEQLHKLDWDLSIQLDQADQAAEQ